MRLARFPAIATQQAETAMTSADLALVSCSDSLGGRRLHIDGEQRDPPTRSMLQPLQDPYWQIMSIDPDTAEGKLESWVSARLSLDPVHERGAMVPNHVLDGSRTDIA